MNFYLSEITKIIQAKPYTIGDALAQIGGFLSFVSILTIFLNVFHGFMLKRSMRARLKGLKPRRKCCRCLTLCFLTEEERNSQIEL